MSSNYSCGSNFEDIERIESSVLMKIFCCLNICCSSPIEIPSNHERLCYHCGGDINFAEDDEYANKYPICNRCLSENKHVHPVAFRKRKKPNFFIKFSFIIIIYLLLSFVFIPIELHSVLFVHFLSMWPTF